ncbi:O-antigen ligase family protein [Hymenobacter sp. 5516J-16]|uniref:O-antigen ligase family protein n=1 Tax=Hymenobacter sp. 5516J-16 TaxID=2932253 RepID=UPI001FD1157D|nr:O-antigen ligase family protein [Hymenobacter sp. 5516J-16]UOQ76724.1 O-antigen ligase family protein [Hymenobacter sp. 5516J-16]
MKPRLAQWLPHTPEQRVFAGFIGLLLGGGAATVLLHSPLGLLPLAAGLGVLLLLTEWRLLYYLLFLTLAFSREMPLPGGLSLDVPSEPLLLVLTGCVLATFLMHPQAVSGRELRHPLVIILLLMLLWSAVSTAFSVDTTKSVKYLLAKTWYLVPFGLGTLLLLPRPAALWRVAGIYTAGACLTVVIVGVRHAAHGFSFESINEAVQLLYRNHVIYAAVLALLLPFTLYGARSTQGAARVGWRVAMGILLFGLITSYTRASVLSLPVAGVFYGVARLRQTRLLLVGAVLTLVAGAGYFLDQNNYMLYAPEFEKTVFNGENFGKHLEATYKLQDVSGMERVYRWVAAGRMTAAKPLVGSGPSTFYPEYKRYTVRSFRTYVSENPEKSTTHNYFLLVLAEQGFPGLILLLILLGTALLTFEHLYHQTRPGTQPRFVLLACGMSLVIIIFHLLLNELVEVDKIGSFFFLNIAMLIRVGMWARGEAVNE